MRNFCLGLGLTATALACSPQLGADRPLLVNDTVVPDTTLIRVPSFDLQRSLVLKYDSTDGNKLESKFVPVTGIDAAPALDSESRNLIAEEISNNQTYIRSEDIEKNTEVVRRDKSETVLRIKQPTDLFLDVGRPAQVDDDPDDSLSLNSDADAVKAGSENTSSTQNEALGRGGKKTSSKSSLPRSNALESNHWFLGVPEQPLKNALNFLANQVQKNRSIKQQDRIVIIDFTQPAAKKRLYVLNLKTGAVARHLVSHGTGSGKKTNPSGKAYHFGNDLDSKLTPPGFHLTGQAVPTPSAKAKSWGPEAMLLHGLEGRNKATRQRGIIVHGSQYTTEGWVKKHGAPGRSHGCPAVSKDLAPILIRQLKEGALWYHHVG